MELQTMTRISKKLPKNTTEAINNLISEAKCDEESERLLSSYKKKSFVYKKLLARIKQSVFLEYFHLYRIFKGVKQNGFIVPKYMKGDYGHLTEEELIGTILHFFVYLPSIGKNINKCFLFLYYCNTSKRQKLWKAKNIYGELEFIVIDRIAGESIRAKEVDVLITRTPRPSSWQRSKI